MCSHNTLIIDTTYGLTIGITGHEPYHNTDSRSHVENLEKTVEQCLTSHGLTPADLTTIIVLTGPGPFTGLRAGIVFAKALAFATGATLIGQNILEPQAAWEAAHAHTTEYVLAVNDARRRQLYYQLFKITPNAATSYEALTDMDIDYPQNIANTISNLCTDTTSPLIITGHGATTYSILHDQLTNNGYTNITLTDQSVTYANGAEGLTLITTLALNHYHHHDNTAANPLYLRRPDAKLPAPLKPVLENSTTTNTNSENDLAPNKRAEAPEQAEDTVHEVEENLIWTTWSKDHQ